MLEFAPSLLQRVRTIGTKLFHNFGIHCATHQIRIILISSVVITSLFYPALAIYSSSYPHALSESTSRILHSFLAANAVSAFYAQHDLRNLWTGHPSLRVRDDAFSRARCGMERTLRVERILVQSPLIEDSGALNHRTLLSTLQFERRISHALSSSGITCLGTSTGQCFVLSPLTYWNHDDDTLLSDINVLDTLDLLSNISVAGVPVTPSMVLAGRDINEHDIAKLDSAMFLALTYFFPEDDCIGNLGHTAWLSLVKQAAQQVNGQMRETQTPPTLIPLEYDTSPSRNKGLSATSAFLYLAYIGFFAYVTWSMRRMDAVHSRIGLTFTALVEIAVSTVTSLSVCALVGFKVTMVPWQLLPIAIVFVGAENMFSLVDAVVKTSITLPVKERIAEGLGRAGTSNTLKVVSYNAILGVIAVFAVGAIRQFCIFAIVVLVAHWFLAHTFFLAVLSIDVQRLELDDLLRQNPSLTPNMSPVALTKSISQPLSRRAKLLSFLKSMLRGRATKNISLLMLLAITATLYYTTYPASVKSRDTPEFALFSGALSRAKGHAVSHDAQGPAWRIWKTLNPDEHPLLHLRVEMPAVIFLSSESPLDSPHKVYASRFSMRTLRPILRMLKIVILPIAATTGTIYGLLLYLLKDAELLEAQRNRAEPESSIVQEEYSLDGRISFSTLPRAFATDVELLATSKNGKLVAAVAIQNELVIWRTDAKSHISIDTTDILLHAASTSTAASALTAVAVDDEGQYCAVGTGVGIIAVWSVVGGTAIPLPHLVLDDSPSGVFGLYFISPGIHRNGQTAEPGAGVIQLLATHENGAAIKWTIADEEFSSRQIVPIMPGSVVRSRALSAASRDSLLIAFCKDDGSVELADVYQTEPNLLSSFRAGNPVDLVSKIHSCYTQLDGSDYLIVGTATDAGIVSLWDGETGECITILEDPYGDINGLRVSPIRRETCRYCGELPMESFCVSFSVGNIVFFHEISKQVQSRRCSCARNSLGQQSSRDFVLGHRSRSNSITSAASSMPPSNARRLSAASNTSAFDSSAFPVSGHGVHSRKASGKDTPRRISDSLSVPFGVDESESIHPLGSTETPTSTTWSDVTAQQLASATFERGGWDVLDTKIIGVRRLPRGQTKTKIPFAVRTPQLQGLTTASLERWELWVFDPSIPRLLASPLATLGEGAVPERPCCDNPHSPVGHIPRLPFTRVQPFLTGISHAFAGFGNTVGLFNLAGT